MASRKSTDQRGGFETSKRIRAKIVEVKNIPDFRILKQSYGGAHVYAVYSFNECMKTNRDS